jgi:glycosyltransferase involved in cell wall biosynthesis
MVKSNKIAVIIPCYKVSKYILNVIASIGKEIDKIYIVDDFCPENSGKLVLQNSKDKRIKVLFNEKNLGVGGAMITGYKQATLDNMDIAVKIDGDGQMDPKLINNFINPIMEGKADYTKGNRFFNLAFLKKMPTVRLIGNALLSFVTKISSGYWDIMDPTNGYTAINVNILRILPLEKIDNRYFFESDMLFRLNTIKACVLDIPMIAKYEDEKSNLKISKIILEFPLKHLNRFFKRLFYNYLLRDFNIGSLNLITGIFLLLFGICFGLYHWFKNYPLAKHTPTGTIMFSALSIILGFQMILFFINYDIISTPKTVLSKNLFSNK